MIRGEVPLLEKFDGARLDDRLNWFNEPGRWETGNGFLYLESDAETDFWQQTHYGFRADSGHFLYATVSQDFVVTTSLHFRPSNQYDQAGLMVRVSPECWLKTSVEFETEGPAKLGVVVTNAGFSDWSMQDFPRDCCEIQLRVTRRAADYTVDYALPDSAGERESSWTRIRMTHLLGDSAGSQVRAGLYACSPGGAGYSVRFRFLRIEQQAAVS